MLVPLLLELNQQPLPDEGKDTLQHILLHLVQQGGLPNRLLEVQVQIPAPQDLVDAAGRTAQPIGVLRARRLEPHLVAAHDDMDALGQTQDRPHVVGRQAVRGKARQVLLVEGQGHARVLAVMACVLAPHHPLELGELVDHARDEVGLGEPGRTLHQLGQGVPAQPLAKQKRQLPSLLHLVVHGAQLLLVRHVLQTLHVRRQRLPPVLRPEEGGVLEAGPQDPFVPLPDRPHVRGPVVADPDEDVRQRVSPVPVPNREVLLVLLHGGDQDLLGDLQIALVERPDEGRRELDQEQVLLQQLGIHLHLEIALEVLLQERYGRLQLLAAFVLIQNHAVVVEALQKLVRVPDLDGPLPHEAVPAGRPAAPHVAVLEGDDRIVGKGEEPADGPGKTHARVGPIHALGERESLDEAAQETGQNIQGAPALLADLGSHVLHPIHLELAQRIDLHALALREAQGGAGGFPLRVVGRREGRPLEQRHRRTLGLVQLPNVQDQAPRRRVGPDVLEAKPVIRQSGDRQPLQGPQGLGKEAGGKLLRSDLQDDVPQSHHAFLPPTSSETVSAAAAALAYCAGAPNFPMNGKPISSRCFR